MDTDKIKEMYVVIFSYGRSDLKFLLVDLLSKLKNTHRLKSQSNKYSVPKLYYYMVLEIKLYTKTFGIVHILIVYLLIMFRRVVFICIHNLNMIVKF